MSVRRSITAVESLDEDERVALAQVARSARMHVVGLPAASPARRMVEDIAAKLAALGVEPPECPLSRAQLACLQGLAEGKTYAQIAIESGRQPSTVRNHLHTAYERLGVTDRAHAVIVAMNAGWIGVPPVVEAWMEGRNA